MTEMLQSRKWLILGKRGANAMNGLSRPSQETKQTYGERLSQMHLLELSPDFSNPIQRFLSLPLRICCSQIEGVLLLNLKKTKQKEAFATSNILVLV